MRDMRPLAALFVGLALSSAHAQNSDHARILDIQTFSHAGSPIAVDAGGVPVVIPTEYNGFTVTVRFGDILYSGEFRNQRKVHSGELIVGDEARVSILQNRMVITTTAGKDVKGRLIRRQRVPDVAPAVVAAAQAPTPVP